MRTSPLLLFGTLLLWASSSFAQSSSLFSDVKARRVGDILTIIIAEAASGTNEASTTTSKETNVATSSSGGTGALKFLPLFGFDAGNSSEFKGEGATTRRGNLRAKMTAKVKAVTETGQLLIEGNRLVEINGEKQVTTLTGLVRPEDITPDNVVYSFNIADAKISYQGKGKVNTGQRPGILTRIINWIF